MVRQRGGLEVALSDAYGQLTAWRWVAERLAAKRRHPAWEHFALGVSTPRPARSKCRLAVPRLIPLAALPLLLGACSSPVGTTPAPSPVSPIACGAVSDLTVVPASDPTFGGAALARDGPVWFSAFGPGPPGKAILMDFGPGIPTKVVIHPDAGPHPQVQVRGVECATGQALRFCYNQGPCGFNGTLLSEADLERAGDAVVTIPVDQHTDDIGYMLFPRSGKYTISVEAGGQTLGAVTLLVG
jgi:hypothetical protein